jgi:hypothetical protein
MDAISMILGLAHAVRKRTWTKAISPSAITSSSLHSIEHAYLLKIGFPLISKGNAMV